jgi:Zn-dependent peptidase ImmA (M78 family)/DNA-binding XRE family transcriptional regulator
VFSPSRLILARKRRGLTLTALSREAGVSIRSISDYENGHASPSVETVRTLAKSLAVLPGFFSLPPVDEIPVDAVSFRALSKMTRRQRDMSIACGSLGVEIGRWIRERYETPIAQLPTLAHFSGQGEDAGAPAMAAEILRARWGLGTQPVGNLVHLLEAHGVMTFSLTGYAREVDAFSFYYEGNPYIFLNTVKSGERGRFDGAHELGHLILHCGEDAPRGPDAEREADAFAAAFLMPEADVRANFRYNPDLQEILDRKIRWQVAAMALTYRLRSIGLLSEWLHRTTCINLSRMGFRSGEPGGIPRESSQLLAKVFSDLRSSPTDLAELKDSVGVSLSDVSDLVFGLVPTVQPGGALPTGPTTRNLRLVDDQDAGPGVVH